MLTAPLFLPGPLWSLSNGYLFGCCLPQQQFGCWCAAPGFTSGESGSRSGAPSPAAPRRASLSSVSLLRGGGARESGSALCHARPRSLAQRGRLRQRFPRVRPARLLPAMQARTDSGMGFAAALLFRPRQTARIVARQGALYRLQMTAPSRRRRPRPHRRTARPPASLGLADASALTTRIDSMIELLLHPYQGGYCHGPP